MKIAEVIGTVTSTIKVNALKGAKFKIVRLIDLEGVSDNSYSLVEDFIGVGIGEKVLIAEDEVTIAKLLDGNEEVPIQFCIVAKIDSINIFK
jgi:microcompartment protein CcmK/EutM